MFERASFGGRLHLDTNINQFWTSKMGETTDKMHRVKLRGSITANG